MKHDIFLSQFEELANYCYSLRSFQFIENVIDIHE